MIAAAYADGVIDEQERQGILERLDRSGLGSEERMFVLQELLSPRSVEELVQSVGGPEQARDVYAASRCAITVDTDAEREYMRRLGESLGLSEAEIGEIEAALS